MAKKSFDGSVADALFSGAFEKKNKSAELSPSAKAEFEMLKRKHETKTAELAEPAESKIDAVERLRPEETTSIYVNPIYEQKKTERIYLRARPDIKDFLQNAAAKEGISVNEYFERLVLKEKEKQND